MFEIFARCKDFRATPVSSVWLRLFARHDDLLEPKLRGRRNPGVPAPPWPPPPPCAPVLPLTLFFSVSPWLCGEYSFGCGYAALCASVAKSVLAALGQARDLPNYEPTGPSPRDNSSMIDCRRAVAALTAESMASQ